MDYKKMMTVAGALICASAMAGVESSVVGYTSKDTVAAKWSILGVQFEGATSGDMLVNDLVSGLTGVDYDDSGTWKTTAPQIQVPNATGYDTYFYLNDAWDETKQTTVAGWADGMGNLSTAGAFTPGVAVWLKSVTEDATATVAGAVSDEDVATVECPKTFALRANVFPLAVTINGTTMTSSDITGVDYDDSGTWKTTAPQIQVPNATGYDTYFYLNDAWDETKQTTVAGWADGMGNLASGKIDAAQGFWTKGVSNAFTLKFTK